MCWAPGSKEVNFIMFVFSVSKVIYEINDKMQWEIELKNETCW